MRLREVLCMKIKYSDEEFNKLQGKTIYGKVSTYYNEKGYGYIRTEDMKEVFFSSFEVKTKKEQKLIFFGSTVKFKLGYYNGRICAVDIELVRSSKKDILIFSEDSQTIIARHVKKYGCDNFYEELLNKFSADEIAQHGYFPEDFDYIYFKTYTDEIRFYSIGCPIQGQGHVNLDNALRKIDRFLSV